MEMRKNQEPTERFAFHLIKSRDTALTIATDGLICEQLPFSIDKYLGEFIMYISIDHIYSVHSSSCRKS
jgi:hypothetical protein